MTAKPEAEQEGQPEEVLAKTEERLPGSKTSGPQEPGTVEAKGGGGGSDRSQHDTYRAAGGHVPQQQAALKQEGILESVQNQGGGQGGWQSTMTHVLSQQAGGSMRPSMGKDSMSPSSTESSHYAARPTQMPMAERLQEEDFLMNLASPQMVGRGQGAAQQQHQRYHPGTLAHEGMAGMPRLAPRALYPEDEMGGGMYGYGGSGYMGREHSARFSRLSMQPPPMQGELRPMRHSGLGASPAMMGLGGHMEGMPQSMPGRLQDEFREGRMLEQMGPSGLQRSASEGMMRTPGGMGHHSTGSGGASLPEERYPSRLGPEQMPGLLFPRNNETPDFAMIYAFLGSMFDPVCHMINHADVLSQMSTLDRETSLLLLSNIAANLDRREGDEPFERYLNNALHPQHHKRSRDGAAHL